MIILQRFDRPESRRFGASALLKLRMDDGNSLLHLSQPAFHPDNADFGVAHNDIDIERKLRDQCFFDLPRG
jgi:hypothetical protein